MNRYVATGPLGHALVPASSFEGLGGFGAYGDGKWALGAFAPADFESLRRAASAAISSIPEYIAKLRATAQTESLFSWFGLGNKDALNNLANTLAHQIPTYTATLNKAIAEGSIERLAYLQGSLKDAIAIAGSEAGGILTPTMKLFIETAFSVPSWASSAPSAPPLSTSSPSTPSTFPTAYPEASPLSPTALKTGGKDPQTLKWVALGLLVVGAPLTIYVVSKRAKRRR